MFEVNLLSQVNWWAVLVVTVLSFPLGTLWHSKFFRKAWFEDAKPDIDKSRKSGFVFLFAFTALSHFVLITLLDIFIGVDANWLSGLYKSIMISVVFVSLPMAVTHAFVGRTIRLILIDTAFYIFYMAIAGIILGVW
jgi:hypothetical protein